MEKRVCKKCGKVIEGFTEKHANSLMMQHDISHRLKEQNKLKGGKNV